MQIWLDDLIVQTDLSLGTDSSVKLAEVNHVELHVWPFRTFWVAASTIYYTGYS